MTHPSRVHPSEGTGRDTRVALHRIAAHVLGRRRFDVCGRFGLRACPGGFATPAFRPTQGGDGRSEDGWPETVRVSGIALVREVGGEMRATPIRGATLRQLAEFVEVDVESDFEAGKDTPSIGDPDDPIDLDGAHVGFISDWFALGWPVLDELITSLGPAARPATLQLWPEHFDAGTHVGLPGGARTNLGLSPGDDFEAEPYLYVGPWTEQRPGDPTYWNAPFGAAVGAGTILGSPDPRRTALDFFRAGMRNLSTGSVDT